MFIYVHMYYVRMYVVTRHGPSTCISTCTYLLVQFILISAGVLAQWNLSNRIHCVNDTIHYRR